MTRRSVESRDQGPFRDERFVVRVDDRYAVEGGKFTSKEFATKYETREAAERLADSFQNAVVEKISIFD